MKFILDQGVKSCPVVVIVCTCGWRSIATNKEAGYTRAAWHETQAHPTDKDARSALIKFRKRRKV